MKEKISLSQRENYRPSAINHFLWWLSTADRELVTDSATDRSRFSIIGLCVLCTWVFASIAWTYFFSTITYQWYIILAGGLLMGFIILCIDRALIKGINKYNKNKLLPLAFRAALALTIGTFMAQPALLYMFRKEIKLQVATNNEKKTITNNQLLDSLYKKQKDELVQSKAAIQKQLDDKYADVSTARNNFLAETDGSGGSGKVGIKDIAIAKRNEYQKLDADYKVLQAAEQPALAALDYQLKALDVKMIQDREAFASQFNEGFLTQAEALSQLIESNTALRFRYYLLITILVLIELMPVIAKLVIPSNVYDEKLALREQMEKEVAASNAKKEQELKELYNKLAAENDKAAIEKFFAITQLYREEKLHSFAQKWKEEEESFDGLWERMKKELLTKQEH